MAENGDRVRDVITGLEGVVVGTTDYLYGCRRLVVQPPVDKDGKHVDPVWVDEPQVEVIKEGVVRAESKQVAKAPAGPRDEDRIRNAR